MALISYLTQITCQPTYSTYLLFQMNTNQLSIYLPSLSVQPTYLMFQINMYQTSNSNAFVLRR